MTSDEESDTVSVSERDILSTIVSRIMKQLTLVARHLSRAVAHMELLSSALTRAGLRVRLLGAHLVYKLVRIDSRESEELTHVFEDPVSIKSV